MTLDQNLESMKETIQEMGKYYFVGFVNSFHGIMSRAGIYHSHTTTFNDENKRQKLISDSYALLAIVESSYNQIPFDKLQNKENLKPLYSVKELIPQFKEILNSIFENNEDQLVELSECAKNIASEGHKYKKTFRTILDKIKEHPNEKDFKVQVNDYQKGFHYF